MELRVYVINTPKLKKYSPYLLQTNLDRPLPAEMSQDDRIRSIITQLFPKYDRDASGFLNGAEVSGFFNEAFQRLGRYQTITQQDAIQVIQMYDKNYDGQVSKEELFSALRHICSTPAPTGSSQPQPSYQNQQQWQQTPYQPQPQQNDPWSKGQIQPNPSNPWAQQNNSNPWSQTPSQPQPNYNANNGWGPSPTVNGVGNPAITQELQLRQYVDAMFVKYDRDNSGSLDANELANVFNEILAQLGIPVKINQVEAMNILKQIDKSNDGRVQKMELFQCIKNLLDTQPRRY